jgi:hypothetical protein
MFDVVRVVVLLLVLVVAVIITTALLLCYSTTVQRVVSEADTSREALSSIFQFSNSICG